MKYWNSKLINMKEYIPGEQPDNLDSYIKLNTNENPFPPSPMALNAMKEACNEKLRRYPNPTSLSVREVFAEQNDLNIDNVFIANGSDEIFTLLFRGFMEPDDLAAFPYPSYSLYYIISEANGISYDTINLNVNLDIDLNDYLSKPYKLVIIGNPNNPTGRGCDSKSIRAFLSKFKGLLVVDEAYIDFYGGSSLSLINEFENLIITRTLSKSYSLAGLRVGIAAAHRDIIRGFLKLKDSYNVDRIAEAGACEVLRDIKTFKYNIDMVHNNKEYLEEKLEELGFSIVPSVANFLFVKHPKIQSEELYERLKEKMILVRHFKGPVQSEYIRITVGSMVEIKPLIKTLSSIIEVE